MLGFLWDDNGVGGRGTCSLEWWIAVALAVVGLWAATGCSSSSDGTSASDAGAGPGTPAGVENGGAADAGGTSVTPDAKPMAGGPDGAAAADTGSGAGGANEPDASAATDADTAGGDGAAEPPGDGGPVVAVDAGPTPQVDGGAAPAVVFENQAVVIDGPDTTLRATGWKCDNGLVHAGVGPWLSFEPQVLDFGSVAAGTSKTLDVLIRNRGDEPLVIESAGIEEDAAFALVPPSGCNGGPCGPGEALAFGPLEPGAAAVLHVAFAPGDVHVHVGALRIVSNDPRWSAEGAVLPVFGNTDHGPCATVYPRVVDFGGVPAGHVAKIPLHLVPCGAPIAEITFEGADGTALSLWSADMSSADLHPSSPTDYVVRFAPTQPAPLAVDGSPIYDQATIVVTFVGPKVPVRIPVRGAAVGATCPAIDVDFSSPTGDSALPLVAIGDEASMTATAPGVAGGWNWRISAPMPWSGLSDPDASLHAASVPVEAVEAGAFWYAVDAGGASCVPHCPVALRPVVVVPQAGIYVELSWMTPGDPDETDFGEHAGSDLDLHFAHPQAWNTGVQPGGWFDSPFDCYWFNPSPDWGSLDPNIDDGPVLLRDDTDGAGPEEVLLAVPEWERTYRVGVHYADDQGFGPVHAFVRVFTYDESRWFGASRLVEGDLWCAALVTYASLPNAEPCLDELGHPDITSDYPLPGGGTSTP